MRCGMKARAQASGIRPYLLPNDTIEVWRISLTAVVAGRLPHSDEAAAARLQQVDAASRWRAGRWALRRILARHSGIASEDVPLLRGRWGKPYLFSGPSFNVTTAGNDVVIVVRATGEIGVDLQVAEVTPLDLKAVAAQLLNSADTTAPRARWARLEAVLKCRGLGFCAAVPAELIATLATTHGQVDGGGHPVWWSDQPHASGALCIAADAPWEQLVERSLDDSLEAPFSARQSPSASTYPPRDRSCPDR